MMTQSQFESNLKTVLELQGWTGITKRETGEMLSAVSAEIAKGLKSDGAVRVRGIGSFSTKKKPATKARKGINPFTKEEQMFKAKPASTQVKVRPAKELKAPFERKK